MNGGRDRALTRHRRCSCRRRLVREYDIPTTRTPTASHSRDETGAAVRCSWRSASKGHAPLVAATRVQLGHALRSKRRRSAAVPGVFTGKPPCVWISEPDRQHRGAVRPYLRTTTPTGNPFNPNPGRVCQPTAVRRLCRQLRARRHRPELQVPADVADKHRYRPSAPVANGGDQLRLHL